MDKNIGIACAVSLVLSVLMPISPIGKANGSEITLFSDNFESYTLGTFPSADWEIVWAGTGENYVTDAYSFSPTKSLQLWGRPNWSSVAQRKFSTDAPIIGYECALRIDSIGTGGPGREESVGFFNREVYIWGRGYAAVLFNHDDGEIKAEDGTVLGDWEPGVWYQVKVALDRSTNTYDVWIDGELKGGGLSTTHSDTELIDALALMSDHAGVKVYYDDVRVFTYVGDYGDTGQWNIDFQGDENHNNTYGQTDPVDYIQPGIYWNIFEVAALSTPGPDPTNYTTNPSMNLLDSEGSSGPVKFSIIGNAYGWAGDAGDDPLTGDYLIILNGFGVTNDPTNWEITGLAPSTAYYLTYYHRDNIGGRGINFAANGIKTTISVPGSSVASTWVTTDALGKITGTADSDGYSEGDWSALTIATVANMASNPHPADGATGVPINAVLSWKPGAYAASHDVYFGTTSPPTFIGNQTASSYDPGTLEPDTTYFWQIDEIEADGTTKHTGDVWSFTTGVKPDYPKYPDITAGLAWGIHADQAREALIWTPTKVFQQTLVLPTAEEVTAAGSSISNVQGIAWSPKYPTSIASKALIWTPTKVFQQTLVLPTVEEVTADGGSISNVRGIVWSPTLTTSTALIWTPTKVFQQTLALPTAKEVTATGSAIDKVQGIVWSPTSPAYPTSTALIWTPTKVFQRTSALPSAEEVTVAGSSISNVRGIVWSPTSSTGPVFSNYTALIWTPTKVFQRTLALPTTEEVTAAGSSISNVQGIVWSPTSAASPTGTALIWTPTKVFQLTLALPIAEEVTVAGSSIDNVQGIACSPTFPPSISSTALIWTPTKVFQQTLVLPTAEEVTAAGSSISNVRGVAWSPTSPTFPQSPTSTALIWTPTKVFQKTLVLPTTEEVTVDDNSISNVRGIVWSPTLTNSTALIWTPAKVFQRTTVLPTAEEVTAAGSAIDNVQGIVWSPASPVYPTSKALILTPTKVFQQILFLPTAEEVTVDDNSIFSYDPALVSTIQAVIHHEDAKAYVVADGEVGEVAVFSGDGSGAGIVGKPASTPVAYTGSSTAAVVVPSSTPPSSHSTVLGVGPYADTALILGPDPVAGVVAGNSMKLFGFYPPEKIPGDINEDGRVDCLDLHILSSAWLTKPGDKRWNPACDIAIDNIIDMCDFAVIATNWHRKTTWP